MLFATFFKRNKSQEKWLKILRERENKSTDILPPSNVKNHPEHYENSVNQQRLFLFIENERKMNEYLFFSGKTKDCLETQ